MAIFGRFLWRGAPQFGEVVDDTVHFLTDLFEGAGRTGESAPLTALKILAPVAPTKLFAIGLNYADHAAESGRELPTEPLMWFKATSSVIAHNESIELAYPEHRTDYEAELAIVIGKRCKGVTREEAGHYIFGYTCGQDISDRNVQRGESQWARAKSMDTYSPLGPLITTDVTPDNWSVQCVLNGVVKQDGNTNQMLFPPDVIVSFLSQAITLEPGDVILTGTPEGIGPLHDGDIVETRIGPLAVLSNSVKVKV